MFWTVLTRLRSGSVGVLIKGGTVRWFLRYGVLCPRTRDSLVPAAVTVAGQGGAAIQGSAGEVGYTEGFGNPVAMLPAGCKGNSWRDGQW